MSTLVYQIIVQHILLIFGKNPSCTPLFHPAHFINFENFSILHWYLFSESLENSILHALFHPAHLINFGKFSSLHSLFHPAWLFDRLEYLLRLEITLQKWIRFHAFDFRQVICTKIVTEKKITWKSLFLYAYFIRINMKTVIFCLMFPHLIPREVTLLIFRGDHNRVG